jgi:DASS family divalent anion:Na+ symporter
MTANAKQLFNIDFDFMNWFKGGILPVLFCILCLPLFIKWRNEFDEKDLDRCKPLNNSSSIVKYAKKELNDVGPVLVKERFKKCFSTGSKNILMHIFCTFFLRLFL